MNNQMREADFQRRIIDYAKLRGWLSHHGRTVKLQSGRYATPIQGDAGFPDLVLARRGVVLMPELKSQQGRLQSNQQQWRDAIGSQWRLWRPSDWDEIVEVLK